jgi:18S rRNA (guanine1575-N7)-methyltransferase
MARRPEHKAPPDVFYSRDEARQYAQNTRMIKIQTQMAERAIELLHLPQGLSAYVLDIGCGTGLSGEALTEAGHEWVGLDIAQAMLGVAVERKAEGGLVYSDMGDGLPFRTGTFDAVISISALQWLCNADKKWHNPFQRMHRFFTSLYACLVAGGKYGFGRCAHAPSHTSTRCTPRARTSRESGLAGDRLIDWLTALTSLLPRCMHVFAHTHSCAGLCFSCILRRSKWST